MAKNRRNQSAAVRFGPALKAFLLCFCIGASGIGYVWQKNQLRQLETKFSDKENQLDKLRRQNEVLSRTCAVLESPRFLETRIQQLNLELIAPGPDQTLHLVDQWPGAGRDLPLSAAQNNGARLAGPRLTTAHP